VFCSILKLESRGKQIFLAEFSAAEHQIMNGILVSRGPFSKCNAQLSSNLLLCRVYTEASNALPRNRCQVQPGSPSKADG